MPPSAQARSWKTTLMSFLPSLRSAPFFCPLAKAVDYNNCKVCSSLCCTVLASSEPLCPQGGAKPLALLLPRPTCSRVVMRNGTVALGPLPSAPGASHGSRAGMQTPHCPCGPVHLASLVLSCLLPACWAPFMGLCLRKPLLRPGCACSSRLCPFPALLAGGLAHQASAHMVPQSGLLCPPAWRAAPCTSLPFLPWGFRVC